MTTIQTFQNSSFKVQCFCVDGAPWFKGLDIATVLGYTNSRKAIIDHVDEDDKRKFEELQGRNETLRLDSNEKNTIFLNESGLYSLILRSEKPEAKTFKKWVCSEVLPAIRKKGTYSLPGHYCSNEITWPEVREKAAGREDALHYRVIEYIRNTYPDAETIAGLGEHLQTKHQRMDGYLKGYVGGQPDIMVLRGLPNGNHDVYSIELKNPNGKGKLSQKQVDYHEHLLSKCHVQTLVSNSYEEVVIALHEHYKEVFARTKTLAIVDTQEEEYDFSTNSRPNYWMAKLKNKTALIRECDKRGVIIDNAMTTLNAKIIEALVAADSKTFHK
jgi:prophage antirepressor-like protein